MHRRVRARLSADARRELAWITVIYLTARILILLVAYLNGTFGHHDIQGELAHWDGLWYRDVANNGYPHQIPNLQTNLGFFPLFPIAIWIVTPVLEILTTHDQVWASTVAGVLISGIGGWVATVLVHRLAEGWWDREAARRVVVLFVVFPGAVVFSMVYSEGLLLSLTAGCLWALERRRWLMAGILAGFGTALQPVALVLPIVCLSAVAIELYRHGWRASSFRRSLIAPVLSVAGAASFMAFLWAWTGTPFANYIAQHRGWGERTDPLAVVHLVKRLANQFNPAHFNHPTIDPNLIFGLIGTVILAIELVLLWRARREVSIPAIVWTAGVAFLAVTSEYVPPNPRMLLTAFPALMVVGRRCTGRGFAVLVFVNVWLLAVLSGLTFTAHALRP